MKTNTNCLETHVPVKVGAGRSVLPDQILMLKADMNYTEVFLMDGSKILSSTTMGTIEKRLDAFNFFRVNRSTVLNMSYLGKFLTCNGDLISIKQGKREVEVGVSRRRQANFFDYLKSFNQSIKLTLA